MKHRIFLALGPCCPLVLWVLWGSRMGFRISMALGIALWMIFWWITRPVGLTVTALLPVVANAILDLGPMDPLLAKYASSSIVLLFAATLLTLPWEKIGLDHRIALQCLGLIGTSMKSQIAVWFLASVLFSTVLPNAVVVAIFTPTALAMLKAAGYGADAPTAGPILCAVCFGAVIGGVGTPVGGAMDVVATSLYQQAMGQEVLFSQWVLWFLPYLVAATLGTLALQLVLPCPVKQLEGTREYFRREWKKLGPVTRDEKLCLGLFGTALVGSFLRPLYAPWFPQLQPAYLYGSVGFLLFFLTDRQGNPFLTWNYVQQHMIWGMLILFAGGLAMGNLLEASGANAILARWLQGMELEPGLPLYTAIALLACLFSETAGITISSAMVVPLVITLTRTEGMPLLPSWKMAVMALNGAFLLPTGIRAIPVGCGMAPRYLWQRGLPVFVGRLGIAILFGLLAQ